MCAFNHTFSNAIPGYGEDTAFTMYNTAGRYYYNSTSTSAYGTSWTTGDVIGVRYDEGAVYFYKNGTIMSSSPILTLTGSWCPMFHTYDSGEWTVNFGQRSFAYSAPTSHKPLCSALLDTPAIADPSDYFDILLWTGNNATSRTFTGLNFAPDFIWHSARSISWGGGLVDAVRGVGSGGPTLRPFSTAAEETVNNFSVVSALNSDGFTVTKGSHGSYPSAYLNQSSATYVAWCWEAGSSTSSNTDGNVTTNVRVSQTAGMSIVTYTGSGSSSASYGHGLNAEPSMIITKKRDGANDWYLYFKSLGNGKFLSINSTGSAGSLSNYWGTVNSTVFSQTYTTAGPNNGSQVAYCFTSIPGFSLISSYQGTGNADGPYIVCGFRPRWIMMKNADTGGTYYDWRIIDADRHTYNDGGNADIPPTLFANASDQERDWDNVDILSNGFKIKDSSVSLNENNKTQIFMAFAENPFQANGGLAR